MRRLATVIVSVLLSGAGATAAEPAPTAERGEDFHEAERLLFALIQRFYGPTHTDAFEVARRSLKDARDFYGGFLPRLAMPDFSDHYLDESDAESARDLRRRAGRGDRDDQHLLGLAYMVGRGRYADIHAPCQAARWLHAAARQNHAHAMGALAHFHLLGFAVETNTFKARELWRHSLTLRVRRPTSSISERYVTPALAATFPEVTAWQTETTRQRVAGVTISDPIPALEPLAYDPSQCAGFQAIVEAEGRAGAS
jgi:hypothetical protein